MNKGDTDEIERIEIQSLKMLFDLPSHMPTPAIIFSFGLLYTSLRIEQRQLNYMWKILKRDSNNWTRKTMVHMMKENVGWGKNMIKTLSKHKLPTNTKEIEDHSRNAWRTKVCEAIEKANKDRLFRELHKEEEGVSKRKSKTKEIVDILEETNYQRGARNDILHCSKHETRVILMSRYRMLECGSNFKGTHVINCNDCNVHDDEAHRLNHCTRFRTINRCDNTEKIDFKMIHKEDPVMLKNMVIEITKVWNFCNKNGTMNVDQP